VSKIPELFHCFEHDGPFQQCLTCDGKLLEISDPYTITKVFRSTECVLEYAMCLPCRQKMAAEFSQESQERLNHFYKRNQALQSRSQKLNPSHVLEEWIQECATLQKPLTELAHYSVACMGFGDSLVFDPFPMMICSTCEQDVQERLSKTTRDQWDKFVQDHFEGPPADALKPDGIPLIV